MVSKKWLLLLLALNTGFAFAQNGKKNITLEDLWRDYTFRVKTVPGFNAMKDGIRYTQINTDGGSQKIQSYDLATGKPLETLFNAADNTFNGTKLNIDEYAFSGNEQKMLLLCESQNIYRRSVLHRVYIFDRNTGSLQQLDTAKVLHAQFSPDGSKVAFVKDNNLFYRDLISNRTVQITTDGRRNEIINGNCDWVYEEEFEFTQAYQWSPDGRHIAWYRFDERNVPEYTMTVYDSLYPTPYKYKYPKAGEPNSVVTIRIKGIGNNDAADVALLQPGMNTDYYIPRIKWTPDPSKLCVLLMNRHQDEMSYLLADAATGKTASIYTEKEDKYIEIADNLHFLPGSKSFVFSAEHDGWNHLYHYNYGNQKMTDLTPGNFDVDALSYTDDAAGKIYYTAAKETPLERKLFSVNIDGSNDKLLTAEEGTHSITPCQGGKYFLDKFSTLTAPPVYYLRNNTGKTVRVLEDNSALQSTMANYSLGRIRFMDIPGTGAEPRHAYIITPPDFDAAKKYPVLMYQYSGPNSQQVADHFPVDNYFWHQMLAEKGYIIVCADGIGTGFRGESFRKKTYLQLGNYESDDQIAMATSLGRLPYVDKRRIGIWGWSYGGFMASTCILKGNDIFKAAIAVAPVTNWRFYDNIYTERYMHTPAENESGYDNNAPEMMASKLKGKFLLIHGTGDDNVHVQNSMMFINNLIKEDKEFNSEFYPNRSHGISGGNTRLHLYRRMTDFILQNL